MISEIFTGRSMAAAFESPWLTAEYSGSPAASSGRSVALSAQAWWRGASGNLDGKILVLASNNLDARAVLAEIPVDKESCKTDAALVSLNCDACYLKFAYVPNGITAGRLYISVYYSEAGK